jgi:hypothetical protein
LDLIRNKKNIKMAVTGLKSVSIFIDETLKEF